jgi:hypothetical protein
MQQAMPFYFRLQCIPIPFILRIVLDDLVGETTHGMRVAPMEQPPRKLSGQRTAKSEHLESGAIERPPKGIPR